MKYIEFLSDLEAAIHTMNPVLVLFYREDSASCRDAYKKVSRTARRYPGIDSYVVDLDKHPSAAGEFLAYNLPTLTLYFNARPVYKRSEDIVIPELERKLAEASAV